MTITDRQTIIETAAAEAGIDAIPTATCVVVTVAEVTTFVPMAKVLPYLAHPALVAHILRTEAEAAVVAQEERD